MQDLGNVRALFLERQVLRNKHQKECVESKPPFFSEERSACRKLWWQKIHGESEFHRAAKEFAKGLANPSPELVSVFNAQREYEKCERDTVIICTPIYLPDGKGGTIMMQNCYPDRFCTNEAVREIEKVLGR